MAMDQETIGALGGVAVAFGAVVDALAEAGSLDKEAVRQRMTLALSVFDPEPQSARDGAFIKTINTLHDLISDPTPEAPRKGYPEWFRGMHSTDQDDDQSD